jgi:hypothetical protein
MTLTGPKLHRPVFYFAYGSNLGARTYIASPTEAFPDLPG